MWEYKVQYLETQEMEAELNAAAAYGWEPVRILADWARQAADQDAEPVDWYTIIFRREKESDAAGLR